MFWRSRRLSRSYRRDTGPDSPRSIPHVPLPTPRPPAHQSFPAVGSLAHRRLARHPRMSGQAYVRLG